MVNFIGRHIGHKIIVAVGIVMSTGLLGTIYFFTQLQEDKILSENHRSMTKVTESVILGLKTVMLAGYADIAQEFAANLKNVPEVVEFRVLRTTGNEAFLDNQTIELVNEQLGQTAFQPKMSESMVPILSPRHLEFMSAIKEMRISSYYEVFSTGERHLTFLAPIIADEECGICHDDSESVRGVLKLTTSMGSVDESIEMTWFHSLIIMAFVITTILLITYYMIRRSVVRPIQAMSNAMENISKGNYSMEVPVIGNDELSQMASSFNRMSIELVSSYSGLESERKKLTTVILGSDEGIVVTDSKGDVVLVNPAAEILLDKSAGEITKKGFLNIFDDTSQMETWLAEEPEGDSEDDGAEDLCTIERNGRILSIHASTIREDDGVVIGSAALIRDVTDQQLRENKLITLSTTDGLTGLFNRRYMDDALIHAVERAKRYKVDLSVMMFDIDHFKKFNDDHGHDQGDRVLQSIAKTMNDLLRSADIPCRYGGEEFLVIMPKTDLEGAMIVAERLREGVEETLVDGLQVTISIGVSDYLADDEINSQGLIEKTDKALYEGKRTGRNRVVQAIRA